MSFLSPLIHLPIQVGSLCPPKISPTDSLGGLHPTPSPSLADPVRHESGLEPGPKKGPGRGEEAPGLVGGGPGRGPSLPRSQGTWPGPGRLGLLLRQLGGELATYRASEQQARSGGSCPRPAVWEGHVTAENAATEQGFEGRGQGPERAQGGVGVGC